METKMEYEAPTLIEVGSFEEITQGTDGLGATDQFFPEGTPRGQLTFS